LQNAFLIQDKGSRHGTFINGEKIGDYNKPSPSLRLKEGDVINFAKIVSFTVHCTDDENQQRIEDILKGLDNIEVTYFDMKLILSIVLPKNFEAPL
jgi:pSer/pThr/pTyr-binding forkhead associated (FHA) protein